VDSSRHGRFRYLTVDETVGYLAITDLFSATLLTSSSHGGVAGVTVGVKGFEGRGAAMGLVDVGRRWLYRGDRAHQLARLLNRAQTQLAARGIGPGRVAALDVVGRRNGQDDLVSCRSGLPRRAIPGVDVG
jgi:hypothetical protein